MYLPILQTAGICDVTFIKIRHLFTRYVLLFFSVHGYKMRGQRGDQRYTGRMMLKDIQKLKVPNWKTLVQERGRWKEVVGKAKTLH